MDAEEEGRYAMEEAEREWERNANSRRSTRSRTNSFLGTAGGFIRTMSMSGERRGVSMSVREGRVCVSKRRACLHQVRLTLQSPVTAKY